MNIETRPLDHFRNTRGSFRLACKNSGGVRKSGRSLATNTGVLLTPNYLLTQDVLEKENHGVL